MKNLALYESRYWIEKFITESLIKIDEMLQARTGNAHILSLKKHNIKTIENFKNETIAYIEKLENEIENLKNPKNIKAGASLNDVPRWEITNRNQKEALRMESVNNLKLRNPDLFGSSQPAKGLQKTKDCNHYAEHPHASSFSAKLLKRERRALKDLARQAAYIQANA